MSWQIVDESCNLNFKQDGVSFRTIPKELVVLEIVLAGEALNDTSVDCVFVRYEGKYAIELPYNQTTVGVTSYASAELLRAAIETTLDTNPCTSGGPGVTPGLDEVLTEDPITALGANFFDGGSQQVYVDPTGVTAINATESAAYAPGGITFSKGADSSAVTFNSVAVVRGSTLMTMNNNQLNLNANAEAADRFKVTETGITLTDGTDEKWSVSALTGRVNGVKVYRALLSQSGTNAPTATVLENTLGIVPTFSYSAPGSYFLETASATFTANKTFIRLSQPDKGVPEDTTHFSAKKWESDDTIAIVTYTLDPDFIPSGDNDVLANTEIEILIYP